MYYRGVLAFLTTRIPVLAANSKGRIEYGSNVLIDSKDIADLEAKVGSDTIEVKDDDGKAIANLTKGLNQLNSILAVDDGSGDMTIGDMVKALYNDKFGDGGINCLSFLVCITASGTYAHSEARGFDFTTNTGFNNTANAKVTVSDYIIETAGTTNTITVWAAKDGDYLVEGAKVSVKAGTQLATMQNTRKAIARIK